MNPSGISPLDLRVLVLPDTIEKKSAGGIILPDANIDQKKAAQCKATLIEAGENAWEEAAARSLNFIKPQPGARILISKYGGIEVEGKDGVKYRLMNDEDVTARLEE